MSRIPHIAHSAYRAFRISRIPHIAHSAYRAFRISRMRLAEILQSAEKGRPGAARAVVESGQNG